MMKGEQLLGIYEVHVGGYRSVMAKTSGGWFEISGDGVSPLTSTAPATASILPMALAGKRVVELRGDGEDLAIRLEEGSFVALGWSIDTATGKGFEGVWFREAGEIDAEFVEYFDEMNPLPASTEWS